MSNLSPVLVAALTIVSLPAAAQQMDPEVEVRPPIHGQWLGPIDLGSLINPPGDLVWAEIVHMTALPPPNGDKVLLWCRRLGTADPVLDSCPPGGQGVPQSVGETWMWDPRSPGALPMIPLPNMDDGTEDIFCGFQVHLADERVIAGSGTNMEDFALNQIVGIKRVFIFDNASPSPNWTAATDLTEPRWYGTGHRLPDKRLIVTGDGIATNRVTRDMGTVGPSSILWDFRNNYRDTPVTSCPTPDPNDLTDLHNYAHMHVLRDGKQVIRANGETSYFVLNRCPSPGELEKDRFVEDACEHSDAPVNATVHFVYPSEDPSGFSEVIYAVGGTLGGQVGGGESLCNQFIPDGGADVSKVVNPSPGGCTNWVSVPSLNEPRAYACAVVLLDGSILVVGGYNWDPTLTNPATGVADGFCYPIFVPERYRPPEIFGNASAVWKKLAPQRDCRTYHGSAVLLSSGVVVSGGSLGTDHCFYVPQSCWHSLEMYYPPYFFKPDPKPTIRSIQFETDPEQLDPLELGQSYRIQATLHSDDSGQFRVALVSPGASTHGVDFNQRYVVLPYIDFLPVSGTEDVEFHITLPDSHPLGPRFGILPEGWYMLTVVNANGMPSEAWWVKIENPDVP